MSNGGVAAAAGEQKNSDDDAEKVSTPLLSQPLAAATALPLPHSQHQQTATSRHLAGYSRLCPPSPRFWLCLLVVPLLCWLLWWSASSFVPLGALIEPPQACLQPPPSLLHIPARQWSDLSFNSAVLDGVRLTYGCLGNITAVLAARRITPCPSRDGSASGDGTSSGSNRVGSEQEGAEVVESSLVELTELFDSVTMNGSYRVMNVAVERYEGGYLLAARLWDGWLWENSARGKVSIAKYQYVEEHRAEISPSLPDAPLPQHNVSSLLALLHVDFRFQPLSEVALVANEPEVQDPRLYWLHDADDSHSSSSRLFVLGNTGYPRLGSSLITIKPRRVMMRSQLTAPTSAETVALPWQSMLSEVAWSDQKNWTPLALHYRRHVLLVSFFPLQLVDCTDAEHCVTLQCDRSTASLRDTFEVADWRGGTPIVRLPPHFVSSANSNGSNSSDGVINSSCSLYLTIIHQRAAPPSTYHYSHRFVVLSLCEPGGDQSSSQSSSSQYVAVRYVSPSFQLPPSDSSERERGLLRYVEYITGLVLEQRHESPFNGQLLLTFGRRDSTVHYLTLELSALLPFLNATNT